MLSHLVAVPLVLLPAIAHEGVRQAGIEVCQAGLADAECRGLWEQTYSLQRLAFESPLLFYESADRVDALYNDAIQRTSSTVQGDPLFIVLSITRTGSRRGQVASEEARAEWDRMADQLRAMLDSGQTDVTAKVIECAWLMYLRERARRQDVDYVEREVLALMRRRPPNWSFEDRDTWILGLGRAVGAWSFRRELQPQRRVLAHRLLDTVDTWLKGDARRAFSRGEAFAHSVMASTWNYQGDLRRCRKTLEPSLQWCERIRGQKKVRPGVLDLAASLYEMAESASMLVRDFEDAGRFSQHRLEVAERLMRAHRASVTSYCNFAGAAYVYVAMLVKLGRLREAHQVADRILPIVDCKDRPDTPQTSQHLAAFLDLAAITKREVDGFSKAALLDLRAIDILRELPEDDGSRCRLLLGVLKNAGMLHYTFGHYAAAHELLLEGQRVAEKCQFSHRIPSNLATELLLRRADLCRFEEDIESAIRLYWKGIRGQRSGVSSMNVQDADLIELMVLLARQGRWSESAELCVAINNRFHRIPADQWLVKHEQDYVAFLIKQYWIARLHGDRDGTNELGRQISSTMLALGICTANASDRVFEFGVTRHLVCAALDDGRPERALDLLPKLERLSLERAASGARRLYEQYVTIPCLRAEALLALGKNDEAAAVILRAAEFEPHAFYDVGVRRSTDTCIRQLMAWQRAMHLLLSVEQKAGLARDTVYERVIPYRGLVFRLLQEERRRRHVLTPAMRQAYERFVDAKDQLAHEVFRQSLNNVGSEPLASDDVLKLQENLIAAETELRRLNAPQDKSVTSSDQPRLESIRKALRSEEVILDFVEYEHHSWDPKLRGWDAHQQQRRYRVYIITRSRPLQVLDLGATEDIDKEILAWRQQVARHAPLSCGRALSNKIWRPIAARLPKATSRIYVCPAGRVALVPWAALPGLGGEKPLVYHFEFASLPYAGFLCENRPANVVSWPPRSIVAVGGVDYGRVAGGDRPDPESDFSRGALALAQLPGTQKEVEQVIRQLGSDRVLHLSGKSVTRDALLRSLPQANWIHLASHGVMASPRRIDAFLASQRKPVWPTWQRAILGARQPFALTALALSHAATGRPETMLLASDVAKMNLELSPVVVLSACDTARGPIVANEGVFSLDKAFLVAGAQAVVSSSWEVPDQMTADFMAAFYREVANSHVHPITALRRAQLALIRQHGDSSLETAGRGPNLKKTLPIQSHRSLALSPLVWGGWVCSGVPD